MKKPRTKQTDELKRSRQAREEMRKRVDNPTPKDLKEREEGADEAMQAFQHLFGQSRRSENPAPEEALKAKKNVDEIERLLASRLCPTDGKNSR